VDRPKCERYDGTDTRLGLEFINSGGLLPGNIRRYTAYGHTILTNDGQSDVWGFAGKLRRAKAFIQGIEDLDVYVGYHGDGQGEFSHAFNRQELLAVAGMAEDFPKAHLNVVATGMRNYAILAAAMNGDVLFTWCDSDTKIKAVLGDKLGPCIHEFSS
jgi:hypothetical protein